MFRFALATFAALASLGSVSADGSSCGSPIPVAAIGSGLTVLNVGDDFDMTIAYQSFVSSIGGGVADIWFSITVENACDIELGVGTCTGLDTNTAVTIEVYDNCAPDLISGIDMLTSATENCDPAIPDLGAIANFENPGAVPFKSYYVNVKANVPFFPVGSDLVVQGAVTGKALGACTGDPHFRRWNHEIRDSFHGECDMVLFHKDQVDGEDVDVHVRTTIRDSYSYVEAVAMKYGEDNIEFQHDALYINGAKVEDEMDVTFGDGNKIAMFDTKKRKFEVNIKNKVFVEVWSTKQFMGVNVRGYRAEMNGSAGILGDYETGDMIARDGRLMENFQDYGFEWQVSPEDPQIFMHAREPQLPFERCRMPDMTAESRRRKLRGQDRKLYEKALEACTENHIAENVQSCVDDVMFTGELDLAYDA